MKQLNTVSELGKVILRRALDNGEVTVAITTDTFKTAIELVGEGLMRQHRNLSPRHDTFKLTRQGRNIAKGL